MIFLMIFISRKKNLNFAVLVNRQYVKAQVENPETSEISKISEIFSEIFKSEFSILAVG